MKSSFAIHKAFFAFCFVVHILVFNPSLVLAEGVEIQGEGCDDLDIDEIARLVAIELAGTVAADVGDNGLVVHLKCDTDTIKMTVLGGSSDRSVERSIVPVNQSVKARVVALSISQLIAVSRMESQTSPGQGENNTKNSENDDSNVEPVRAEDSSYQRLKFPSKDRDIFITGGGKLKLGKSLVVGNAGVKGDLLFSSNVGVTFLLDLEAGSVSRSAGTVTTMAVFWGIGVVGRFFRRELFFLETGIGAFMGYAYLQGNPEAWATGKSAGGMTGEFALLVAPTVTLQNTLLSIILKGGYTLENPVGSIIDEREVTIGGFWLGVDLCVGFRFGLGAG